MTNPVSVRFRVRLVGGRKERCERLLYLATNVLYKFEYHLKDHLGNVRVVFGGHSNGQPEYIQRTDYYPFGLVMAQKNYTSFDELSADRAPFENKYLYNGKEWQNDEVGGVKLDWYDYGARMYDPELGRFHTIDPMAEEPHNISLSPYHYCTNNPIKYIDINGEDWFVNSENGNLLYVKGVKELSAEQVERYGENYTHFGADNMFGSEVNIVGEDGNILERNDYEFGPTSAEEFMKEQGYDKGERVQMEKIDYETQAIDDGTLSGRTISQKSEVQVGDSEVTYVKPENFNKRENTRKIKHQDDNQKYIKENYSKVVPYGTAQRNSGSKVSKSQVRNDILKLIPYLFQSQ